MDFNRWESVFSVAIFAPFLNFEKLSMARFLPPTLIILNSFFQIMYHNLQQCPVTTRDRLKMECAKTQ